MHLYLRRSQRDAGMLGSKVVFSLSAKIQPSAEEEALIKRYRLGRLTVYSSETHQARAGAAQDALQSGTASGLAKGLVRMGMAALSLRCTIDSLVQGQTVESEDLSEVIGAEEAIVQACINTRDFIAAAISFDGRQEVFEI
jgi:hypothetical protein